MIMRQCEICGHGDFAHTITGGCHGLVKVDGEQMLCECKGFLDEGSIDHPAHYNMGEIEVIAAIEDWKLGYHEGNVVKYVARAKHKGCELQDLKKAAWYLERRIKQLELP